MDRQAKRRRNRRRRILVYGTLLALIYGFWVWVPWEFDFIPRRAPHPNPEVDPDSSHLFEKGTKVMVITAHPDDSEFYIGGTLSKLHDAGAEIWQVIVTDGDKAYYGPFSNAAENRKVRHAEALAAAQVWGGKNLVFLGYYDGRLRTSDRLVRRLRLEMARFQPEYVLSFDFDYPPRLSHGDHRQTGEAVALAVENAPSVKWLMRFSTLYPNYVSDISNYWDRKEKLLQVHKSQFHGSRLEGVTNMVQDSAIRDGERIGTTYGEGFRCTQLKP